MLKQAHSDDKAKEEYLEMAGKQIAWMYFWALVALTGGFVLFGWKGMLLVALMLIVIKVQARLTFIQTLGAVATILE